MKRTYKVLAMILAVLMLSSTLGVFSIFADEAELDIAEQNIDVRSLKLASYHEERKAIRVKFSVAEAYALDSSVVEVGGIVRNDKRTDASLEVDSDGNLVNTTAQAKIVVFRNGEQIGNVFEATDGRAVYTAYLYGLQTETRDNLNTKYSFIGYAIVKDSAGNRRVVYTSQYTGVSYNKLVCRATGHNYNSGEITTVPTGTADGEVTYTCERCLETKTEALPMPNAIVTENEPAPMAMDASAFGAGSLTVTPAASESFTFGTPNETDELFNDWYADYVISFDKNIDSANFNTSYAGQVILYGSYGSYGNIPMFIMTQDGSDLTAGTGYRILQNLAVQYGMTDWGSLKYYELQSISPFTCGAITAESDTAINAALGAGTLGYLAEDTTVTIKLNLYENADGTGRVVTVSETSFVLAGHPEEPPEAAAEVNVPEEITLNASYISSYIGLNLPDFDAYETNSMTFATSEGADPYSSAYKDWVVDFTISFSCDVDSAVKTDNSFYAGNVLLYGSYGDFGTVPMVIMTPDGNPLPANTEYRLLKNIVDMFGAGSFSVTYKDMVTVTPFTCGTIVKNTDDAYAASTGKGVAGSLGNDVLGPLPEGATTTIRLNLYEVVNGVETGNVINVMEKTLPLDNMLSYGSADVTTIDVDGQSTVSEETVISGHTTTHSGGIGEVTATVPEGVVVEDGTSNLTVSVIAVEDGNVTVEDESVVLGYDVEVTGISEQNTVPVIVKIENAVPANMNLGNVVLYHTENGTQVQMTERASLAEVTGHNDYFVDSDGTVYMALASFSPVSIVYNPSNPWKGGVDTSWYNDNDTTFTLTTADQLAGLAQLVNAGNTFEGKTVKLGADIVINDWTFNVDGQNVTYTPKQLAADNDLIYYNSCTANNGNASTPGGSDGDKPYYFTPIGTDYNNPFCGTFDGQGHSVSGLFRIFYGENDQYDDKVVGLFGGTHGATIQNLTIKDSFVESYAAMVGLVVARSAATTFNNITLTNNHAITYNYYVAGIAAWDGTNGGTTSFNNITIDETNDFGAIWGTYDVCAAGVLGGVGSNVQISFNNCDIAPELNVYNDACANYQWFAYRYSGMLIGRVPGSNTADITSFADSHFTFTNCRVSFGDWSDQYYCELMSAGKGSYNDPDEWKYTRIDRDRWLTTGVCGHDHAANNAASTNGYGDTNENHQGENLRFRQFFGGGQGVYGVQSYEGITVTEKDFTAYITAGSNGTVDNAKVKNVPAGATITADGNNLKVNGVTVATATPDSGYGAVWKIGGNAITSYTTITGDIEGDNNTYITVDFEAVVTDVTVTWKNYDGTVLETDTVTPGTTPTYDGAEPTRAQTAQYTYTFTGWSPAVGAVTEDTVYTAQFNSTVRTYTVTWNNYDGTTLETDSNVAYGDIPTYDGSTPKKTKTAQYTFTFSGWSPTVEAVGGNVTYTAQFSSTVRKYTIQFRNRDGSVVLQESKVEYGTMPVYNGSTPSTWTDSSGYNNIFVTWNTAYDGTGTDITNVTGNATYYPRWRKVADAKVITVGSYTITVHGYGKEIDENYNFVMTDVNPSLNIYGYPTSATVVSGMGTFYGWTTNADWSTYGIVGDVYKWDLIFNGAAVPSPSFFDKSYRDSTFGIAGYLPVSNIDLYPVVGYEVKLHNNDMTTAAQAASAGVSHYGYYTEVKSTLYKHHGYALTLATDKSLIYSLYNIKPRSTFNEANDQRYFIEWNTSIEIAGFGCGTSYINAYTGNADVDLYAIFGYPIILNANGGTFASTGTELRETYVLDYGNTYKDLSLYGNSTMFDDLPTRADSIALLKTLEDDGTSYNYFRLRNADGSNVDTAEFNGKERPIEYLTIPPTGGDTPWSDYYCGTTTKYAPGTTAPMFFAEWGYYLMFDLNLPDGLTNTGKEPTNFKKTVGVGITTSIWSNEPSVASGYTFRGWAFNSNETNAAKIFKYNNPNKNRTVTATVDELIAYGGKREADKIYLHAIWEPNS